ncbi:MAG: GrpB family protein [Sandaracinus sp.]
MPAPFPVVLLPHDPAWAEAARREAERFTACLPAGAVTHVHPIGSTSIPGIRAKPILDLLPVAPRLEALDEAAAALEAAGYVAWGEYGLPGRRFFTRDEDGRRVAHLHCYAEGSPEITRHLAFRDYLRAHPDVARAYDEEKQRAVRAKSDSLGYHEEKSAFVKRLEGEALAWARRAGPR